MNIFQNYLFYLFFDFWPTVWHPTLEGDTSSGINWLMSAVYWKVILACVCLKLVVTPVYVIQHGCCLRLRAVTHWGWTRSPTVVLVAPPWRSPAPSPSHWSHSPPPCPLPFESRHSTSYKHNILICFTKPNIFMLHQTGIPNLVLVSQTSPGTVYIVIPLTTNWLKLIKINIVHQSEWGY